MSRLVITTILGLIVIGLLMAGGWWLLNSQTNQAKNTAEWLTYENKELGLTFTYPSEYEVVPGQGNNLLLIEAKYPTQAQLRGLWPVKIYYQSYGSATSTFADFTTDLQDNLILNLAWAAHQNEVDDINTKVGQNTIAKDEGTRQMVALEQTINEEVLNYKDHYSFKTETINGLNALIHNRDFYTGNSKLLEAYFDWGTKALVFSSEADNTVLDRIYHSVKKI